jgi:uncharacterized membrane protein
MKNRIISDFFWHFDRAFGNSRRWAVQIVYVLAILLVVTCFLALLGFWVKQSSQPMSLVQKDRADYNVFSQTIGMIFNASNLPPAGEMRDIPVWWQVLVILVGAVVFTGFTITFVSNFLNNRINAYRDGSVRYYFNNHILFLGGSKMIPPMIRELYKQPSYRKKHFVILTSEEPQSVRRHVEGTLTQEERNGLRLTVLRGYRDDKPTLQSVWLDRAARIYIIGDNPYDPEHDSTNMDCWNKAKELCSKRENVPVPCFLLFCRASSTFLFRHRDNDIKPCLDTTVINRMESVAQRVLVHNDDEKSIYPPLDRDGISKDSERTVHFVLYGMTATSYALSTTAAHLCHFPNFVTRIDNDTLSENKNRRTKITLIAPNIKEELSYMITHLDNLFSISKCELYESHEGTALIKKDFDNKATLDAIGDFLDIEWEFIEGNIADKAVRERLKAYYQDNMQGKTYLTVALCEEKADRNAAAALYLPSEFHQVVMKEDKEEEIDYEKTIPILVYQPESEALLKTSNKEIAMFRNILSFGSVQESYDPSVRRRITEGKRISYIYNQGLKYTSMTADKAELDKLWRDSKYAEQMSNIYSASHIGVKLRSVGNRTELTDEEVAFLAVTEHNRWNVEKLLMGYEALSKSERDKQRTEEGLGELKRLKKQFKHYCIAPYSELLPEDRQYDTLIVRNLGDVVEKTTTTAIS